MRLTAIPKKISFGARFLFIFIGVVAFGFGVISMWHTHRAVSHYQKTTGTVVETVPSRSSEGSVSYSPVVEFKLPNGTMQRFTTNFSTNVFVPSVGETVSIYYDPMNPTKGYIDSFFFMYGMGAFFAFLGLVFVIISLVARNLNSGLNDPLRVMEKAQNDPEFAQALKVIEEKLKNE